jgi:DNA-binding NtrC family response regulator
MLTASRSKATVLIVEDDAITREILAQLLQTGGFDVIVASTGAQGLLLLSQQGNEIDWLVTKVNLPGLVCGWILEDEYHAHHPDRPVLLVSAVNPADAPSARAVFIPPAAPMRALEILQALKNPAPAQAIQFPSSKAA